jgi:parallel beta-helix repeat protein
MVKTSNITIKLLIIAILFSLFYSYFPINNAQASGTTIYVDDSGGADYTVIQDAIDAANESDTVYVYSGTYNENIVIDKNIELLGAGTSSVTLNGNSDHTIKINSNNVKISALTIKNTGDSFSCIFLISVSDCQITNNIIQNAGNGIYLISSNSNTINNNIIEYNNIGLYLSNSDSNTLYANTFQNNNANGIFLTSSSTDNTIYLNDFNDWEDNGYPNARDDGSNNWNYNSQGNYWDDYDGYDSEPDGIGDTPYSINGNGGNKDFFPLGDFQSMNEKPVAYIDSISPNPAASGQSISFNGHGSDDGDIVNWEWRSNGNLISSSEDFQRSNFLAGSYEISFRVQDDDEIWSNYVYRSLTVNTQTNTPPTASIIEPKKSSYMYGKTMYFIGSGSDSDGDSLTGYSWRSDPEYISSNEKSFSKINIPVGQYTVYFKVRDSQGDWSQEKTKTFEIKSDPTISNNPPVADAGGPYSGIVNITITFNASNSYDPDIDDQLSYSWNFGDGNTAEGLSVNHIYENHGTYTLNLTVVDSHGESCTNSVVVKIEGDNTTVEANKENKETPGFELLIFLISIILIIYNKKNKK